MTKKVKVFEFPDNLLFSTHNEMRKHYENLFHSYPNIKAKVLNRMKYGNYVIDYELITGRGEPMTATVIYEIRGEIKTCGFYKCFNRFLYNLHTNSIIISFREGRYKVNLNLLATQISKFYKENPMVEAVLLGGSVSRNWDDEYSDIELFVF